jgi:SAM-dependent methyltransferase
MMPVYDRIAAYYDLTHDGLTVDVDAVVALAKSAGGPVVELGCGSGRLLQPLARAGVEVTGVDSSPAMLARAGARLAAEPDVAARVRLVQGDITSLELPGTTFALALFGYNTFMHLDERAALLALRRVRALLAPGGRLWLDLENPFALADLPVTGEMELEAVFEDLSTGWLVRQWSAYAADTTEQVVDVVWVYETTDATGAPLRTEARFRQHYTYPHQLDLLLAQAGLKLVSLAGDYDGSPFDEDSERLIALATS